MIPGDLLSTCPHKQFHTLPGLLDSQAALPNSNPNACVPMQGGSLYHFYDGLWYDPAGRRTHDHQRYVSYDTLSQSHFWHHIMNPYDTLSQSLFWHHIMISYDTLSQSHFWHHIMISYDTLSQSLFLQTLYVFMTQSQLKPCFLLKLFLNVRFLVLHSPL